MHKDIKTRHVIKGTIKQLDKGVSSSHRIRETYAKTKERINSSNQPEENSPTEYANERALRGGRFVARKSSSEIWYAGQRGLRALKEHGKEVQQKKKDSVSDKRARVYQRDGIKNKSLIRQKRSHQTQQIKSGTQRIKSGKSGVKITKKTSREVSKLSKNAVRATQWSRKFQMSTIRRAIISKRFMTLSRILGVKVAMKATGITVKTTIAITKLLLKGLIAGGWVAVLIILICTLFGSILFLFGNNNSSNHTPVSQEVLAYESVIREIAREHGIEEFTLLIMAVMMQESRGRGNDPMQSSESPYNTRFPNSPNSITDPIYSIEVGVRHLRGSLYMAQVENPIDMERIPLALQGYNFGNHYIPWAIENFGGHSMASAIAFSEMMAARLGWASYGDINYPRNVLRYYPIGNHTRGNGSFVFPVGGNWSITSPFGMRPNPFTGVLELHEGMDLITDIPNAPIYAIADGTVVFSSWDGGYGNHVIIQHDETTFSGYAHNQSNLVRVGDRVIAGQQIAIMGTTGSSTGVHLHLNIMMNTANFRSGHVDPAPLLGIGN